MAADSLMISAWGGKIQLATTRIDTFALVNFHVENCFLERV